LLVVDATAAVTRIQLGLKLGRSLSQA